MIPPTQGKSVTRAEFDAMILKFDGVNADLAATRSQSAQTHDMVADLHRALVEPSPGQQQGLLDRMASVTISFESGRRVGAIVVWIAGFLVALGAIVVSIRTGIIK